MFEKCVDICCVQKTRFMGNSMRMISRKTAEYKLFRIRNEKG